MNITKTQQIEILMSDIRTAIRRDKYGYLSDTFINKNRELISELVLKKVITLRTFYIANRKNIEVTFH